MNPPLTAYDVASSAVIYQEEYLLQRALVMVGLHCRARGWQLLGIFYSSCPKGHVCYQGNRLDLTLFSYVFLLFDIYSPFCIPCRN